MFFAKFFLFLTFLFVAQMSNITHVTFAIKGIDTRSTYTHEHILYTFAQNIIIDETKVV